MIEANLVKAWRALVDRYQQRAEKPFSVDPETLRRADRPPDYVAFREAAINLLIHQDYADHTRKPSIRFFDDRTLLWNPGDTFASAEELLDPGEKEVRNPRIVAAFRRIGLSEQAGTGIRAIFDRWRRLGRVPPIVDNDKARKAFQLTLLKEELLSEEQLLFQASLGVRLGEAEARSFAFACREGRLRPRDVRAVTGLSGADVQAVLERPGRPGAHIATGKRRCSPSPGISRDDSAELAGAAPDNRTWSLTKLMRLGRSWSLTKLMCLRRGWSLTKLMCLRRGWSLTKLMRLRRGWSLTKLMRLRRGWSLTKLMRLRRGWSLTKLMCLGRGWSLTKLMCLGRGWSLTKLMCLRRGWSLTKLMRLGRGWSLTKLMCLRRGWSLTKLMCLRRGWSLTKLMCLRRGWSLTKLMCLGRGWSLTKLMCLRRGWSLTKLMCLRRGWSLTKLIRLGRSWSLTKSMRPRRGWSLTKLMCLRRGWSLTKSMWPERSWSLTKLMCPRRGWSPTKLGRTHPTCPVPKLRL